MVGAIIHVILSSTWRHDFLILLVLTRLLNSHRYAAGTVQIYLFFKKILTHMSFTPIHASILVLQSLEMKTPSARICCLLLKSENPTILEIDKRPHHSSRMCGRVMNKLLGCSRPSGAHGDMRDAPATLQKASSSKVEYAETRTRTPPLLTLQGNTCFYITAIFT
jgi:hypothetical protein